MPPEGHDRFELHRVQVDRGDLADGHAADLHRGLLAQLADLGEACFQLVALASPAPALVGRGHGQHHQRGQGQQQEGADGEFESGTADGHVDYLIES
ncbi:hypothetical protein G6F22_009710 [Rhizopus arrhizus]|nr:hypothetical protein G6F22_009710 [Rhizopus arrhizus]